MKPDQNAHGPFAMSRTLEAVGRLADQGLRSDSAPIETQFAPLFEALRELLSTELESRRCADEPDADQVRKLQSLIRRADRLETELNAYYSSTKPSG